MKRTVGFLVIVSRSGHCDSHSNLDAHDEKETHLNGRGASRDVFRQRYPNAQGYWCLAVKQHNFHSFEACFIIIFFL